MVTEREQRLREVILARQNIAAAFETWRQQNPTAVVQLPAIMGKFFESNMAQRILDGCESDLVRLDRHACLNGQGQSKYCGYDVHEWPCLDYLDLEFSYQLLTEPAK